ncbi:MAG: T9SS type A sorting domain-containing protein [bacterium]
MLNKLFTLAVLFAVSILAMGTDAFARTTTRTSILWTKSYSASHSAGELEVTLTKSNALYIEPANYRYLDGYHTQARRTNIPLWTKTIGGPKSDKGHTVIKARGDALITVDYKRTAAGGYEIHLTKTDADGGTLWEKTYSASDIDKLVLTGWTLSFSASDLDVYTLSLAPAVVAESPEEEDTATDIETFQLSPNYPNPFNPSTTITYSIPNESQVTLKIYNLLGQQVATLLDEKQSAGAHTVIFDASHLASGYYVYRLQAGKSVETRKMMLLK